MRVAVFICFKRAIGYFLIGHMRYTNEVHALTHTTGPQVGLGPIKGTPSWGSVKKCPGDLTPISSGQLTDWLYVFNNTGTLLYLLDNAVTLLFRLRRHLSIFIVRAHSDIKLMSCRFFQLPPRADTETCLLQKSSASFWIAWSPPVQRIAAEIGSRVVLDEAHDPHLRSFKFWLSQHMRTPRP